MADLEQGIAFFVNNWLQNQPPKSEPDEWGKVQGILEQNKGKNFIQRIMKPDVNPLLDEYAGPGTHGTHLMASAEVDGKNIAYPHIIQTPDGNLKLLNRKEAVDYALKHNEYVTFDTQQEAEWFGKNYKRVWGQPGPMKQKNDALKKVSTETPLNGGS